MTTSLTNSGSDMAATVPVSRRWENDPKGRRVTAAFASQLGWKECTGHRWVYGHPNIRLIAEALLKAYVSTGNAGLAEQFLHGLSCAIKSEMHRPYSAELLIEVAQVEATQLIARQGLGLLRTKANAFAWRRRAYEEVSLLLGAITSVEREFGL